MRATIAPGEYYHIYNRGVEKRAIFVDIDDYWRFITLLIIFQGKAHTPPTSRLTSIVRHSMSDDAIFEEIIATRVVQLVCFCLMPNHFHFILTETKEGGISSFMQRLGDAYTKYFNLKRERTGHLFCGKYQSVHVSKNNYLNHLSAYIHMNPCEIADYKGREFDYPWSSFQDYVSANRWGVFLDHSIISDQFRNKADYRRFVLTSWIKTKTKLQADIFMD